MFIYNADFTKSRLIQNLSPELYCCRQNLTFSLFLSQYCLVEENIDLFPYRCELVSRNIAQKFIKILLLQTSHLIF